MATKPAEIVKALFAHAALMETTGPTLPIAWPEPDTDFAPPTSGGYLEVSHFPNIPAFQGLASGVLDQGLLQVTVVWPRGQGLVKPTEAAGQVAAHFPKTLTLFSGSTKVTVSGAPVTGPRLVDADRISIPVTIPWTA